MKAILNKIDLLANRIEGGWFTRLEALDKLKELRSELVEKFGEGSPKFMQCVELLTDANEIANEL